MVDNLLAYINRYTNMPLNAEEAAMIRGCFHPKKLRKKQYFLQEGDHCRNVGFIVKGAMRQYSVDEKGVEHMINLYLENWWVSNRESAVNQTPSQYNIDAWEDTDLLVATISDMLHLVSAIPSFGLMTRVMDERSFIATQKRLNSTITNSADKRYEEFAVNHPQFIQRFPQHLIASYLGITKDTLSRIRKQGAKK